MRAATTSAVAATPDIAASAVSVSNCGDMLPCFARKLRLGP